MKSYLRFLSRNRLYTVIMAAGLSVSLAFVIIMSCFVWQQYRVGRQYPDFERVYILGYGGSIYSSPAIGFMAKDQIPDVEGSTRIVNYSRTLATETEQIGVMEAFRIMPDFFDFFPCRFIAGGKEGVQVAGSVAISKSLATRLGGENIIGKTLYFDGQQCTVCAVYEDFKDSIFHERDILICDNYPDASEYPYLNHIGNTYNFIKLRNGADEDEVIGLINRISADNATRSDDRWKYQMTRLDELYMAESTWGSVGIRSGDPQIMKAFGIIVIFLLVSSIFNYINLSSALSGRRSREMATRMLHGDNRTGVITRSIVESLAFVATCMVIAIAIACALVPKINDLIESDIPIEISMKPGYILLYAGITLLIGLSCSIVPSIVSVRFTPLDVTKGTFRYYSKKTFAKIFIIIQNVIAVIIIAVSLTMTLQIRHMKAMPLNANVDSLYCCSNYHYDVGFEQKLKSLPYVTEFGRSFGRPCGNTMNWALNINGDPENEVGFSVMYSDTTAFRLFDYQVVHDFGQPGRFGMWLTESTFKRLELDMENPVLPKELGYIEPNVQLAGIIKDFPVRTAINMITDECTILYVFPEDNMRVTGYYVVKMSQVTEANKKELFDLSAAAVTDKYGSGTLVRSGYIKDLIDSEYAHISNQLSLVNILMAIAIMLAAMGQMAMSTYYATEREKEIGIRKVFGGTVRSESMRNIFEYMVYCLIATAVAVPVAVWITGRYLETFTYRMPPKPWIYVFASLTVFAISLASVLWQTLRAARTNPADALKKE